jgi:hypothetical protein
MAGSEAELASQAMRTVKGLNGNTCSTPDAISRSTNESSSYRGANNSGCANDVCGFPRWRRWLRR